MYEDNKEERSDQWKEPEWEGTKNLAIRGGLWLNFFCLVLASSGPISNWCGVVGVEAAFSLEESTVPILSSSQI